MTEHELPGHWVVVRQDKGDEWPYIEIDCTWGNNPERPCRMINCDNCQEDATEECLDPDPDDEIRHPNAYVIPGCGMQDYLENVGAEGFTLDGLVARKRVEKMHWDEGWHLEL